MFRKKLADKLLAVRWIDAVIILLGAVMINEFYVDLAQHSFDPYFFSRRMLDYALHNNAPPAWNRFLIWIATYGTNIVPLFAYFTAISTVFLMLLIARGFFALIVALFFLDLWMSQWVYPGSWIFEFLFPAIFGMCAALATLPEFAHEERWLQRILGPRFFGEITFKWRFVIVVLSSLALWYAVYLSNKPETHYVEIAWHTAFTFGILFLLLAIFDYIRPLESQRYVQRGILRHLERLPWLDIMTVLIGSMLIIQVYSDIAVKWFTIPGYSKLISVYIRGTNAPTWMKAFLALAKNNAAYIMPLQFLFETTAAITFSTLILRTPMVLFTALFLLTLMYTEFGVPARWPAHPNDPHTWTWELMFVTVITFFIGFHQLGQFLSARSWRARFLGYKVYGNLSFIWRFIIAILGGLALGLAGIATHVFGAAYRQTSFKAAVTFFICLLVLGIVDYWRPWRNAPTQIP